jgi:phage shock protein PspC (stress-responsive transcriptional regulator)
MMLASVRIETVLVVLVVLNLIGLTIAAYIILRRK